MDKMDVLEALTAIEEIDVEDLVTEDHSSPKDPLVNLTKAPIPNIPESQVGQSIKTKVDVSNVRNLDTSKMNVQLINPHETVRYHVPEFPHSSATFNIIVGSCIQAFS